MKLTYLAATLIGVVVTGIFATDASAMYNPTTGTWMQRDPGGAVRPGVGSPTVRGGFIQRDQYRDGMSLYQYVRGCPVMRVDPHGLFGTETHLTETQARIQKVVDSICRNGKLPTTFAADVAAADEAMDDLAHEAPLNGLMSYLTLGLANLLPGHQEDYDNHFPGAGPIIPFVPQNVVEKGWNNAAVMANFKQVTNRKDSKGCNEREFGRFLHDLQDSFSHGGGRPDWGGHPKGVTLFDEKGNKVESVGLLSDDKHNPDAPRVNHQAWTEAMTATEDATRGYLVECHACDCGLGTAKDEVEWLKQMQPK